MRRLRHRLQTAQTRLRPPSASMGDLDWSHWRARFDARADRPLPPPPTEPLPDHIARDVGDALTSFHRGEAGEGQTAKSLAGANLDVVDADFRIAIRRFVREEGRHARILKGMLGALGRSPARRDWAVDSFRSARRMSSLPLDVMWLATAEIVGLCTYHQFAERLPPSWASNLRHVAADEALHLTFFLEFARRAFPKRRAHHVALPWMCGGAQVVNSVSNRRAFRSLGVDQARLLAHTQRLARWGQAQLASDVELAPELPGGLA